MADPDSIDGLRDSALRGLEEGQLVFGRYRLLRVLGQGGMGIVWSAADVELAREVALKFVPEQLVHDAEAVADLKRETIRCLELTHPHIVRIYDIASDRARFAISMELVDGGSLSALKANDPAHCLPISRVGGLMLQLLEGLEYAHESARIVHRDLKPANLMVTKASQLKIADFGIASTMSDSLSRVTLKPSSGTLQFMSPQQACGGPPTPSDDLYAFGATVYDLLTGKPPFYTGNIFHQLEHVVPPPMEQRRAELGRTGEPIPPVWEEAVAACLAKEARDRPPSARELREWLAGRRHPVPAPPDAPTVFSTELEPATRRLAATPPAALSEAPTAPSPATAASPGRSRLLLATGVAAGLVLLVALAAGAYVGLHATRSAPAGASASTPAPMAVQPPPPRTEPPPASAPIAATPPPAPQPGRVVVNSIPSAARVAMDGSERGYTPLLIEYVAPGIHRLSVGHEGYEAVELVVDVEAGRTIDPGAVRLTARAEPKPNPTPTAAPVSFAAPMSFATPAPATLFSPGPTPAPAPNRAALARALVKTYLLAHMSANIPLEASCFDNPVEYEGEGVLNAAGLRHNLEEYHHLWPSFSIPSFTEVNVADTPNPAYQVATFSYNFIAANPRNGKVSKGTANETFTIHWIGPRPAISRVHENVTDRHKNY